MSSVVSKNFYFKWYPDKFRSDPKVRRWSIAERGLYREMLDSLYIGKPLPDDVAAVAEELGFDIEEVEPLWPRVRKMFGLLDGNLTHHKVQELMDVRVEESTRNSENGKKGGRPPKNKEEQVVASSPEKPKAEPPKAKAPSTSSSPGFMQGPSQDFTSKPKSAPVDVYALMAAFAETAGDRFTGGVPTDGDEAALTQHDATTLGILGAHVAAGLHWAQADGNLTFNVRRLVKANLANAVAEARAWDKGGRKKKTKTGMAEPMAAATETCIVDL